MILSELRQIRVNPEQSLIPNAHRGEHIIPEVIRFPWKLVELVIDDLFMLDLPVVVRSVIEEYRGLQDTFLLVVLLYVLQEESGEGPVADVDDGGDLLVHEVVIDLIGF